MAMILDLVAFCDGLSEVFWCEWASLFQVGGLEIGTAMMAKGEGVRSRPKLPHLWKCPTIVRLVWP